MRREIEHIYSASHDMTFVIERYVNENDLVVSENVIAFYYGEPDDSTEFGTHAQYVDCWQGTVKEILTIDNYTIIYTHKEIIGDEYIVCFKYDKETMSWASGTYCTTLEVAMAELLRKLGSDRVKGSYQMQIERKYEITYDRLLELATYFKDKIEAECEDTTEFFKYEEPEMDLKELELFEIYESESEEEE